MSHATMRAAVLDRSGAGLRMETILKPEPNAGEVLVRRSIRLVGSYGGRTRTDMPALIRLIEARALTVDAQISTRVPLDDAGRVYEALDRGEVVGRALVLP
jgi:Zn-dependent alcohol dehydrogenase